MRRLEEDVERSKQDRCPVSLLMMDLDNFKELNDRYGHGLGDLLLKRAAEIIMTKARRDVDVPVRYGGRGLP